MLIQCHLYLTISFQHLLHLATCGLCRREQRLLEVRLDLLALLRVKDDTDGPRGLIFSHLVLRLHFTVDHRRTSLLILQVS